MYLETEWSERCRGGMLRAKGSENRENGLDCLQKVQAA
jgi:hypothetical protein